MLNKYPAISIVTPSYNQAAYIEQTIDSVLSQGYPNLQYCVIDGGSTDNSVEIIKKYEKYISYWISEKDHGQSHAINKGLLQSTGEIFNWLNSDDYLESRALFKIAEVFNDPVVHIVAGRVRNFSETYEEIVSNQNLTAKGLICWDHEVKFVQPGVWLRRHFLEKCGGIDEHFQYAFDWDLYIRYLYQFPNVKEIDDLLVHFRLHDNSKTILMQERFMAEERMIIEKLYNLSGYESIKETCALKIQKTGWTSFLSDQSKIRISFFKKCINVLFHLHNFPKVSLSRQTVGAIRAFWMNRQI
jgi:glycosyltransferase involved in cell wall biosynthesis